jgi:hypothetical protein
MGQEPVSGFLPLIFILRDDQIFEMKARRHAPDHAISKKRQFYVRSISGNFCIQHLRFF